MICEAYKDKYCMGCDAGMQHYFKLEEAIEKNEFEFYENKKTCKTLEKYREEKKARENNDLCKSN